jgi:hypothetical protein
MIRFVGKMGGQPGAGVGPGSESRRAGEVQGLGCLLDRQPAKDAEFRQLGRGGINLVKLPECHIEVNPRIDLLGRIGNALQGQPSGAVWAAALAGLFAAGVIDEYTPHRFGGGSEEVAAVGELYFPRLTSGARHQTEIRLMHQRSGVERVAVRFVRHVPGRQLAQLVVNKRQQLRRGVRAPRVNGGQNARDFRHVRSLAELRFAVAILLVT